MGKARGLAARLALGVLAVGTFAVVGAPAAHASLSGPCEGGVYATPTSTEVHNAAEGAAAGGVFANPAKQDELDVQDGSYISGYGHSNVDQTMGHADIDVFGFPIPIKSGSGKGRDGSGGPYAVSDISKFINRFVIEGGSDACSGRVLVIIQGKNPVTTIVGAGALVLALIGLAGVFGVALRRRPA